MEYTFSVCSIWQYMQFLSKLDFGKKVIVVKFVNNVSNNAKIYRVLSPSNNITIIDRNH